MSEHPQDQKAQDNWYMIVDRLSVAEVTIETDVLGTERYPGLEMIGPLRGPDCQLVSPAENLTLVLSPLDVLLLLRGITVLCRESGPLYLKMLLGWLDELTESEMDSGIDTR